MNAILLILKEHERFRKTFADIQNSSHRADTKIKLFKALCMDLIRHETMEQKVWYPQLKKYPVLNEVIKHLLVEERSAAKAIQGFKKIKTEEAWQEKFMKLKKDVEHHATEEERKLFPKVEKRLNEAKLIAIGKAMREFKMNFKLSLVKRKIGRFKTLKTKRLVHRHLARAA